MQFAIDVASSAIPLDNAHVADARNRVPPDRIPHDEAIEKLCVDCHEEGCPESLEVSSKK